VNDSQYVKTVNREAIWQVQTPQAFDKRLIQSVHEKALQDAFIASDDTTLVAHFTDIIPRYILGDERSIKLTTPYDIKLLEVIL
jgi:2-C-methyl-D-erythritol 4-phosphate cytidylyltransferase